MLNAEKAKVGDEVILKTKSVIRQNGQVVIQKGSKSSGRVTDVQRKAKGGAGSRISVLVGTLKHGNVLTPISASRVSVTSVASRVSALNDSLFADSNVSSSSSASGGSTISLGSGNLKLEKGTTLRLSVSESSNTTVTKGN